MKRHLSLSCVTLVLTLIAWPGPATADEKKPLAPAEIEALIAKLGDQEYSTRELSSKRLKALGEQVKTQLSEAAASGNAEIRHRLQYLLTILENRAAALRRERQMAEERGFEIRMQAFVSGEATPALPGWPAFQKIAGDTPDSRAFFAQMLRNEQKLFEAYETDLAKAHELLETTLTAQQFGATQLSTLIALMFVAGDEKLEPLSDASAQKLCNLLSYINRHAASEFERSISEKLILRWLDQKTDDSDELAALKMNLEVPFGRLERAMSVLKNRKAAVPQRMNALFVLLMHKPGPLDYFEPLLEDTTPHNDQLQTRDIILALLVRYGDHVVEEYDFSKDTGQWGGGLFGAAYQGKPIFDTPEKRDRAFKKWRAWRQTDLVHRARLKAFAEDVDGSKNLSLPGWAQFRKFAGATPADRSFFVEMYDQGRRLLDAYENHPDQVPKMLETYYDLLQNRYHMRSLGLNAVLAFVAGDGSIPVPLDLQLKLSTVLNSYVSMQTGGKPHPALLQKLVNRFEIRTAAINKQLETFVATGRDNISLPGWEAYRQIVGNSPASRKFFVSMLRNEPTLLAKYQQDPAEAARAVDAWVQTREQLWGDTGPPLVAVLLLLAGDEQVKLSEAALTRLCNYVFPADQHRWGSDMWPDFNEPTLRKLLIRWLETPTPPSMPEILAKKALIVARYRLSEKFDLVLDLARDPEAAEAHRARALVGLAFAGDSRHLELIEPILEDKHLKLRDLTLAVLVHLSRQRAEDYSLAADLDPDSLIAIPHPEVSLKNVANREHAIAKWRDWSKADSAIRDRLKAFADDPAGSKPHTLPGWERYRQVAGDTAEARAFFVEMQGTEGHLLKTYENNPKQASEVLERRCATIGNLLNRPIISLPISTVSSLAAFTLVAGDDKVSYSDNTIGVLINLLQREECARGKNRLQLQPLIAACLKHSKEDQPFLAIQKWNLAKQYGLKEQAIGLARQLLKAPDEEETQLLQQQAMFLSTLATVNDLAYLEVIEPLLKNSAAVQPESNGNLEIQLADVALASMVRLSNQNWNQYKLRHIQGDSSGQFHWQTAYFDDTEDRIWALAKWNAQPKAKLAPKTEPDAHAKSTVGKRVILIPKNFPALLAPSVPGKPGTLLKSQQRQSSDML